MARSFSGRGMTLAQINAATQTEIQRKQQAQQAALRKLAEDASLQKAIVQAAAQSTATSNAKQTAQAVAAVSKVAVGSAAQTSGSVASKANPAITVGRTERVASSAPAVGDTVIRNGKTYTWGGNAAQRAQIKAAEAAAKAAAEAAARVAAASSFSTASINTNLIGGITGDYYEIDSALESIYSQATAAGVSIAKPSSYGSSITDAAKAQAIIDSYTAKANNAISAKVAESTVYDTSAQFKEVYDTARGYGVTVAMPAVTQYKTAAAAQAALDNYVERVNTALANAPAPTYTNIDPQKTSGYSYTVGLSHAQQNNLIRRNQTRKQQGKPELSEFEYRQENGISTETTQGGNYVKPKLTNKSYSSNGSGTVKAVKDQGPNYSRAASVGSGDIKIANIKASAKTISPSNKAVSVISAADTQKRKQAAVTAKNAEAAKATAEAAKAAQAKKEAEAELAAKQKALVKAQAAAKKTTSVPAKTALQQQAKTLQKDVNASKTQVKAATEAANATAQYANAMGENAHYAEIAVNTGSAKAAQKASTALKNVKSTKVRAAAATKKAEAIGVTTHDGQILLKDGTWINQVQSSSKKGTGESSVKVFGTTKSYTEQMAKEYKDKLAGKTTSKALNPVYAAAYESAVAQKKAEAAAANKAATAYKVVGVGKNSETIIDAIQVNGKFGTGAGSVRVVTLDKSGNVIAASKTAKEYQATLKAAVKNAAVPITAETSAADKKAIQEARNYITSRQTGAVKIEQKKIYASVDAANTPVAFEPFAQEKSAWNQLKGMGKWAADSTIQNISESTERLAKSIASVNPIAAAAVGTIAAGYGTVAETFSVKPGSRAYNMKNDNASWGDTAKLVLHSPIDVYKAGSTELSTAEGKVKSTVQNSQIAKDISAVEALTIKAFTPKEGSEASRIQKTLANTTWVKPNSEAARVIKSLQEGNIVDDIIDDSIKVIKAVPTAAYEEITDKGNKISAKGKIVASQVVDAVRIKEGSVGDYELKYLASLKDKTVQTFTPKEGSEYKRVENDVKDFVADPKSNIVVSGIIKDINAVHQIFAIKEGSRGDYALQNLDKQKDRVRETFSPKEGSAFKHLENDVKDFVKDPKNNIVVHSILKDANAIKQAFTVKEGSEADRVISGIRNSDIPASAIYVGSNALSAANQLAINNGTSFRTLTMTPYMRKHGGDAVFDEISRIAEESKYLSGVAGVVQSEINRFEAAPVSYTGELAAMYYGGKALGVGTEVLIGSVEKSAAKIAISSLATRQAAAAKLLAAAEQKAARAVVRAKTAAARVKVVEKSVTASKHLTSSQKAAVIAKAQAKAEKAKIAATNAKAAVIEAKAVVENLPEYVSSTKGLTVAKERAQAAISKARVTEKSILASKNLSPAQKAKWLVKTEAAAGGSVAKSYAALTDNAVLSARSILGSKHLSDLEKLSWLAKKEGAIGKTAIVSGKDLLKYKAAEATAMYTRPVVMSVMGLELAKAGYDTVKMGDLEQDVQFIKSLAIGGKGFASGMKAGQGPLIELIPGVKTYSLAEISGGSRSTARQIRVGETYSILGKTLATRDYRGTSRKVKLPKADVKVFQDKKVQPLNKEEIPIFEELVRELGTKNDMTRLETGYKLTSEAYTAERTPIMPDKFDIVSKNVPEAVRPALKTVLQDYMRVSSIRDVLDAAQGYEKLQVYGSSVQPAQMGSYFTRKPGDLEVEVTNVAKFTQSVARALEKKGLKEGKDFRIMGGEKAISSTDTTLLRKTDSPKIEFKTEGKWEKGIEVFSSKAEIRSKEDLMDLAEGFKPIDGIPYGFELQKSLKVDYINIMRLQEQAAHKYEGATVLDKGILTGKHEGRRKDPRDLIEQLVANHNELGIHKEADIVAYTKAVAKHDPAVVRKSKNPDEAKIHSPIAEFIVKHNRLPTKAEVTRMTEETPIVRDSARELLLKSKQSTAIREIVSDVGKVTSIARSSASTEKSTARVVKQSSVGASTKKSTSSSSVRKVKSGSSSSVSKSSSKARSTEKSTSKARSTEKSVPSVSRSSVSSRRVSSSKPRSSNSLRSSTSSRSASSSKPSTSNSSRNSVSSRSVSSSKPSTSSKAVKQISSSRSNPIGKSNVSSGSLRKSSVSGSSPRKISASSSSPSSRSISSSSPSSSSSSSSSNSSRSSSSGSKSASSSGKSSRSSRFTPEKKVFLKKKRQKAFKLSDRALKQMRLKRKIQNRLGSLESMFGSSSVKKTTKKPAKAMNKHASAKKTVKRVRRA